MNHYRTHTSGRLLSAVLIATFIPLSVPVDAQNFSADSDRSIREVRTERGHRAVADELIVQYAGESTFRVERLPRGKSLRDAEAEFESLPGVVYAEPNYIAEAFMVPNDTNYGYQWHFSTIGMESAWDISTGNGVVVAVIDTGVAYEDFTQSFRSYYRAPDLAQTNFVAGYDYINNDSHPNDDNGHGTHVAGTIAGSTNDTYGVAGIAFNASIMPIKVLDRRGSGTYDAVANGIRYAADNGAKVINLSLGGTASSQTLLDAVAYAHGKGVTVVAASGNNGSSSVSYPAAYDQYVIAVGATRYDNARAPYSNYGSSLDLVAPGGDTSVDQNGDGYGDGILQQTFTGSNYGAFGFYYFQGTSMATPHVAGVAALVLAHGNATTPQEVRSALEETATDLGAVGRDNTYGFGLVNPVTALSWGTPPPPPVYACSDGLDNDGDSFTDYPSDVGCTGATDTDEVDPPPPPPPPVYACSDGIDNDDDTFVDYPADLGCADAIDTDETDPPPPPPPPTDIEVFTDSFEISEWNGLWSEDSQNDWFRSTQRETLGTRSAEVDGGANNASLTSIGISLAGKSNATITFDWFIENGLDTGEYVAFDVSTNGGSSWTEYARLRGNVDTENIWHSESIEVTSTSSVAIRFRATMNGSTEDANVDNVVVVAHD